MLPGPPVLTNPAQLCAGCSFEELLAGVRRVLDIFVEQGFAINAAVSDVVPASSGGGGSFRVKLEGPANLWALQVGYACLSMLQ